MIPLGDWVLAKLYYTMVRVYSPLHIKTYNVQDKATIRPVIGDSEIASLSTYWDSHKELLIPHIECSANYECQTECNFKIRANADFLVSRIINDCLYDLNDKNFCSVPCENGQANQ